MASPLPQSACAAATSLQERLARRIAEETGTVPVPRPARGWSEPEWEQVAPGIECKLLATDTEGQRVSMLVRLAPDASYPGHTHVGVEELHLLDGELWIGSRCQFAPSRMTNFASGCYIPGSFEASLGWLLRPAS